MTKGITKAKVGIVGTGHGLRTIVPALESTNRFHISAVSGRNKGRVLEQSEFLPVGADAVEFEELLEMKDLDLVCIASPNEFHLEHIVAVSGMKTNLYIEKPITSTLDQAKVAADALGSIPSDKFVVVGHQLRFNPFIRRIADLWKSGQLGHVYSVVIRQRGGAFAAHDRTWTWEFEKNKGGGVRLAMGTHLLDLINFMSGKMPKAAFVNMDPVHMERAPVNEKVVRIVDVCNSFSASLDYAEFEGIITTSAAAHVPNMFEIEVLGSEGGVLFDGTAQLKRYIRGKEVENGISETEIASYLSLPGSSIFRKSLCEMASEMVKAIMGEENCLSLAVGINESIESLNLLEKEMEARNERVHGRAPSF